MSDSYENVVGGRLKLKGKALDVKAASGGINKKKKKKKQQDSYSSDQSKRRADSNDQSSASVGSGANTQALDEPIIQEEEVGDAGGGKSTAQWDDHLTPAERRYVEQKARIDMHSLAKTANKSHRDRIQDFNQYLANLSEHYDIPKVGPG